ncbi:MAG: TRAP transporter substrate-binding protein DctP [Opitutaceae bacterium]
MRLTLIASFGLVSLLSNLALAATLNISHQFPGGTLDSGDFRDRLCRKFAVEIEKRSKGALSAKVFPAASFIQTNAQFSAVSKGSLDLALLPLANTAFSDIPELSIGLMPGLVTSYEIGLAWKNAPIGREISALLAEKNVIIVSWIWQAGGLASRSRAVIEPDDAKGLKIRGGSIEMDQALQAAGATAVAMPSNEIYAALKTGALDAAISTSTSLISFHLEHSAKYLTSGRDHSYWFTFEPLIISKSVFQTLPKDQQELIMKVGAEMEEFAIQEAKADDNKVAEIYLKAGAKVYDLSAQTAGLWREMARDTSWKKYAEKGPRFARLIQLADDVIRKQKRQR